MTKPAMQTALRVRPPTVTHLVWLYLLASVPTLTEFIDAGHLPRTPREYTTDLIMTVFVLVAVTWIIRLSKRIADEVRSNIASNEQLHHANRLATVGQLAAGIAHELGSPLQVVAGRAKMVATGEAAEGDAKESGQIILEQAQRMTQIIRGLLDFSRRRPAQPSVTDLQGVARDTLAILGSIAKKRAVALEIEVDGPGPVYVDSVQIRQALTNLVVNAIQAVSEGGHVTIFVRNQRVSPPPEHSGPEGDYACLGVRDDGPGINEQDRSRVFEPFFTTKDVGEGTGLGLAVTHGLVRENGGWIAVESEIGHGACFSIFLSCSGEKEGRL